MKRIGSYLLLSILMVVSSCEAYSPEYDSISVFRGASLDRESTLAIVTVKEDEAGLYLQYDDQHTAEILNPNLLDFQGEARCMTSLRNAHADREIQRDMLVYLDWIEPIPLGDVVSSESYSVSSDTAPVDILTSSWMTVAEDGYLTLRYAVMAGGEQEHSFTLVKGVNPDYPFELRLIHRTGSDPGTYLQEGLVAFRLDFLPDTKGNVVPLKINYTSLGSSLDTNAASEEASIAFAYKTRK